MTDKCHTNQHAKHGVTIHDAVGPNFEDLRPLSKKSGQPVVSDDFPVYRDLALLLSEPMKPFDPLRLHPDKIVAHTLGVCAGYTYSDIDTITLMMARMGLEKCRCRTISLYVDAMFIISTAYIIQSEDGKVVILVYRGTQPGNFINWLTDADLSFEKVRFNFKGDNSTAYDVHAGFYRNFRATQFAVGEVLDLALKGKAVSDLPGGSEPKYTMETLYITGHSLGAAMAALMAIAIQNEPQYDRFRNALLAGAVYTFGQPMIGSRELADKCTEDDFIRDRLIRFIYQKDPVPHLPPLETSHHWKHFGREYQYVNKNRIRKVKPARQMYALQLAGAFVAFIVRLIPYLRRIPFTYQFNDHGPQHYITALTPDNSKTEFGDHNYVSDNHRCWLSPKG